MSAALLSSGASTVTIKRDDDTGVISLACGRIKQQKQQTLPLTSFRLSPRFNYPDIFSVQETVSVRCTGCSPVVRLIFIIGTPDTAREPDQRKQTLNTTLSISCQVQDIEKAHQQRLNGAIALVRPLLGTLQNWTYQTSFFEFDASLRQQYLDALQLHGRAVQQCLVSLH